VWGCDLTCYDCDGGDCPENDPGCTGEDPYCGDGYCDIDESYETCPEDCEEEEYNNCDYCPYTGGYPGTDCCDTAWYEYGLTCNELESIYNWDCEGCICPGDGNPVCGDGFCSGDETYETCPDDCLPPGSCAEGDVADCADDDCCPESWIGDGYADCSDQAYGCDLTCYDCDGGDCPENDPGCTGEEPYCGDEYCDIDESYENCPEDCGELCPDAVCVTNYTSSTITQDDANEFYNDADWFYEGMGDTIHVMATYGFFEGAISYNLKMLTLDGSIPEFISYNKTTNGHIGNGQDWWIDYDPLTEGEIQIQDWGENGIYAGVVINEFGTESYFWSDKELHVIPCTEWNDCPEYFYCKSDYDNCSTTDDTGTCVLWHYGECGYDYDPVCSCNNETIANECHADFFFTNIAYTGECDDSTLCEDQGLITCPDGDCAGNESYCTELCEEGFVEDCYNNEECRLESWIGDGIADCGPSAGEYADLTCYDCDGGDCPPNTPGCEELEDCCSPGDYNCDTSIDVLDIVAIVSCILEDADCPCGDLNGDGSINVLDVVMVVSMILGN